MSDNQNFNDVPVDRHTETVVTQQPGYAATEQVTYDVAAQRRMEFVQVYRIFYTLLGVVEILLGLRFVLKLIGANPASGFSVFVYAITDVLTAPFNALVATPALGGSVVEITTLVAMLVYALAFWVLIRILRVILDRPSARTATRSTSEHIDNTPRR